MSLAQFTVDGGTHNMDGLRLYAQDGAERVEAFIGRKVMDAWAGVCRAAWRRTKSVPQSIQCAWQSEPCSD